MRMPSLKRSLAYVALATMVVAAPAAVSHDGKHPDAPNPSPNATVSQEVGYAAVTVIFGRPGVKGRKIWGELVPYNGGEPRPWLAGANGNAVITFEEAVKIDGNELAAGSYGLMMVPAEDEWTIIFSKNSKRMGIIRYTPDEDVLRIKAKPQSAEFEEWLDYKIKKTGELTADLSLHWENLKVGFTIEAQDHRTEKEES